MTRQEILALADLPEPDGYCIISSAKVYQSIASMYDWKSGHWCCNSWDCPICGARKRCEEAVWYAPKLLGFDQLWWHITELAVGTKEWKTFTKKMNTKKYKWVRFQNTIIGSNPDWKLISPPDAIKLMGQCLKNIVEIPFRSHPISSNWHDKKKQKLWTERASMRDSKLIQLLDYFQIPYSGQNQIFWSIPKDWTLAKIQLFEKLLVAL